jgi:hypothetical protein
MWTRWTAWTSHVSCLSLVFSALSFISPDLFSDKSSHVPVFYVYLKSVLW